MSARKKNKLSLSKKKVPKNNSDSTPTILSLFKKQKDRQSVSTKDGIAKEEPDSGSESDVVITKVVKSKSGTIMSNLNGEDESLNYDDDHGDTEHTQQVKNENDEKVKPMEKENLTLDTAVRKIRKSDKEAPELHKKPTKALKTELKRSLDLTEIDESSTVMDDSETAFKSKVDVRARKMETTNKSRLKTRSWSAEGCDLKTQEIMSHSSRKRKLSLTKSKTVHPEAAKKKKTLSEKDDTRDGGRKEKKSLENEQNTMYEMNSSPVKDERKTEHEIPLEENQLDSKQENKLSLCKKVMREHKGHKNKEISSSSSKSIKVDTQASKKKVEGSKTNTISIEKTESINAYENDEPSSCSAAETEEKDEKSSLNLVAENESQDDVNGDLEEGTVYRVPYYLENFHTIIDSVLNDTEYCRLFDDSDMDYITAFRNMPEPCQKLYVRMFGRKLSWLPMVKLKYPEISDDIPALVENLIAAGFLKSGDELSDLHMLLKLLSAPDLKALAKSFHLNTANTTKPKLVELLLKKSQQNSIGTMFAGSKGASTYNTMLKRARSYIGKVSRLQDDVRAVFIRLLMLFCLYNTNFDEESGSVGQNQLFQMLMVNIGKVKYPSYTVNKKKPIFKDREAVVRFETALQFEMDILHLVERGKWSEALDVYEQARKVGEAILKSKQYRKWDSYLPEFLRLYTAGSIYVRIANQGVEILQRQKKYGEAVKLLEELLAQELYCNQYRGHWYERLALNLEAHLKKPAQSLDVIQRGLSDTRVRSGRRLAIYERAKKICDAPKSKFASRIKDFIHDPVSPTPETVIEGMVISDATSMGMKYQFVMQGDADSVTLCAVEELVLEHYKHNGYPEGLHAEGSIIANLFTLYFWDILYMDVEDVFQGPFQSCPLDLYTQDFYTQRKDAVDDRLSWLRNATEQELLDEVKTIWEEHSGAMCIGMNWERFPEPETHQGLVSCMNGHMLAGILERYVKDPRHTRSGFPDLTLWNTDTKTLKISEVKGPNDRLSYKQILWIDYLLKLGIDAEVCYVKAVGSKKLKPKPKEGQ